MNDPKIATVDIETFPMKGYFWGTYDQFIAPDFILEDWSIAAVAWKWLGNKRTYYTDVRDQVDFRQDYDVLTEIWSMLDEADIVVAHNGKKFDIKKINARLIEQGFPPYSPVKVVDTLLEARKIAAFTSNKLIDLTRKLTKTKKSKHAKYPGNKLWTACMNGDRKAWDEMEKYNKIDIVSTEELYVVLRPWMSTHPNWGLYVDRDVCPNCGGDKLVSRGYAQLTAGTYQRYKCSDCGRWSRGSKRLSSGTGVR